MITNPRQHPDGGGGRCALCHWRPGQCPNWQLRVSVSTEQIFLIPNFPMVLWLFSYICYVSYVSIYQYYYILGNFNNNFPQMVFITWNVLLNIKSISCESKFNAISVIIMKNNPKAPPPQKNIIKFWQKTISIDYTSRHYCSAVSVVINEKL